MAKTLQQILQDVGAYVDQDTSTPTGTELTVRINFIDQALRDWSDSYDWKQLRLPGTISAVLSGTSAALPTRFRKFLSPLYDMNQVVTRDREYIEIDPSERFQRQSTDHVIWVGGDEVSGMYVNGFGFISNFSGVFDYQALPSSMATLSDTCVCPNPGFITKKAIGYILEARSDTRFPQVKDDADLELRKMIEFVDTPTGAQNNRIPDWPRSTGFVMGEE